MREPLFVKQNSEKWKSFEQSPQQTLMKLPSVL